MEAVQSKTPVQVCAHCETPNEESARFCKSCGAALRPPAHCPHCNTVPAADDEVCRTCGTQLVGARPGSSDLAARGRRSAAAPASSKDQERLDREAASLKAPARPNNNIIGNALLFVAFLMVFVVFMQVWTKDAPKEFNPFEGGPPPSAQGGPPPSDGSGASVGSNPDPAAAATDPTAVISGRVELRSGLPSGFGTLFVIVRSPGATRGAPIAVKKISNPAFPQAFSISSANTMFKGVPFTGPYDVHVRLDQDGDPITKSAGDLVASQPSANIKPGGPEIVLTLDTRL